MTRLNRRRSAKTRRRARVLLLIALCTFTFAAVVFFTSGLVVPGLAATVAGLATAAAAERRDRESR